MRENVPVKQIFVTGNTGIDALRWAADARRPVRRPASCEALYDERRAGSCVVTAHRRENWGDGLRGIGEGVARLAERAPRRQLRPPAAPEPERAQELGRAARRSSTTCCSPSRSATPTFARLLGALRPRHHRLGRHPGGGAGRSASRCSSRARRPSAPRASRPARSGSSAPIPDASYAEGAPPARRPEPLRGDVAEAREPVRRRPRRPPDRARRSIYPAVPPAARLFQETPRKLPDNPFVMTSDSIPARRGAPHPRRRRRAEHRRRDLDGPALPGLRGRVRRQRRRRDQGRAHVQAAPDAARHHAPRHGGLRGRRAARRRPRPTPIIFLTARDSTEDKVRGLTIGGDDYVTKPFSLEELVARVRLILRRTGAGRGGDSTRTA